MSKFLADILTNYKNPNSLGTKLRVSRSKYIIEIIDSIFLKKGRVDIIDIGGTKTYWNILPPNYLEKKNVYISIINLPGFVLPENDKHFFFYEGDGCNLDTIVDNQFDLAHSNSVIEHVGDYKKMQKFANEIKRVANNYYIQTPYFWFPIEPHALFPFFHYLPKFIRASLLLKMTLANLPKQKNIDSSYDLVNSIRLLNRKRFSDLFMDANIISEKFFFISKSLIAIKQGK